MQRKNVVDATMVVRPQNRRRAAVDVSQGEHWRFETRGCAKACQIAEPMFLVETRMELVSDLDRGALELWQASIAP